MAVQPAVIRNVDENSWPETEQAMYRRAETEGDAAACSALITQVVGEFPASPVPGDQELVELVIAPFLERVPEI